MEKTPLMLAFGKHWGVVRGIERPPDRKFFRESVLPFIEKRILGEGRRGILIHEHSIGVSSIADLMGDPEKSRLIRELVDSYERSVNGRLRDTLGRGVPLPPYQQETYDWGLLQDVMRINSQSPHRIANIIEPQNPELIAKIGEMIFSGVEILHADKKLERAKLRIKYSKMVAELRDRKLAEQVERLRREEPARAIIITRGLAHRGMSSLYNTEDYDVVVAAGGDCVPSFRSDALTDYFGRELCETELIRYAKLQLHARRYFNENWDREPYTTMRKEGKVNESIRLLKLSAREFALRSLSELEAD